MRDVFKRGLWVRVASCTSCSGAQSWLVVRLFPAYCPVRLHRLVVVTPTVKLVEPVPMFPALSVALAEKLFVPTAKLAAEALMVWQVVESTPESASVAVQEIVT